MPTEKLSVAVVAPALSSDPREATLLSRRAGFSGLQFDAYSAALDLPSLSGSGRREFLHVLSGQDQRLVGLRYDLGSKGLGPGADVDRALAKLEEVMELAAGMMAPLVCVDAGRLPEPPTEESPKPKVAPDQAGLILLPTSAEVEKVRAQREDAARPRAAADAAFVSQVDAALADLGGRADRYGVTLAFRSDLSSLAALDRALRAARCPWFGVDLDPVGILRDDWDADEVFSRLGGLVRHVRGRDAVGGA